MKKTKRVCNLVGVILIRGKTSFLSYVTARYKHRRYGTNKNNM